MKEAKIIKSSKNRSSLEKTTALSRATPVAYENELRRIIQEEAYILAEEDGFNQAPEHYWYIAEEEVYRNH